jgi:hypothetical protein
MRAPEGNVLDVSTAAATFRHQPGETTWRVTRDAVAVSLGGQRQTGTGGAGQSERPARPELELASVGSVGIRIGDLSAGTAGLRFELAREHYRRTEATWEEAGSPSALVVIGATAEDLLIEVTMGSADPNFAAARDDNPLDNEHPDVNSDGVQIHLTAPGRGAGALTASWLIVPEPGSARARVTGRDDASAIPLEVTWRPVGEGRRLLSWRRAARGWQLLARVRRDALGARDSRLRLDVIVNEMPRGRERRRGQLVLSGRGSGWAYLRGDRQDRDALIPVVVRDA